MSAAGAAGAGDGAPLVRLERTGGVLLIELNRPHRRNALDRALVDELDAALDQLDDDPTLRVGVLAGAGPVFCAGTDLHEPESPATPRGGEYGLVRRRRRVPLVAAVEGPALGGGFELVLACDLVVAGREASFGLPEVKRGLVATCAGLFRTPDRVPPSLAAELLLTGDPISAERASAHGLVNVLCEPGRAVAEAQALAERIARNSPAAVSASLAALREARGPAEAVGWTATDHAIARIRLAPDAAEGVAAFFEKREPRWADPVR